MSGPAPPADLAGRRPRIRTLEPGTILHRFYTRQDGLKRFDPIHYDRSAAGRFNAPDGAYGVLYAAERPHGAFAETFLRTAGRRLIDLGLLRRKTYAELRVVRPLALIVFDGRWLAPLGATAAVPHGDPPYAVAQSWSRALQAHAVAADGIAYTARHDPDETCFALFEAASSAVEEVRRQDALDGAWFWDLAGYYEVGLAP